MIHRILFDLTLGLLGGMAGGLFINFLFARAMRKRIRQPAKR